jgi:hypothetical protein
MWNMDNYYDFNEEFDGTTGIFRQPTVATMHQPNDSSASAIAPLASAPSAVSSAVVRSS